MYMGSVAILAQGCFGSSWVISNPLGPHNPIKIVPAFSAIVISLLHRDASVLLPLILNGIEKSPDRASGIQISAVFTCVEKPGS